MSSDNIDFVLILETSLKLLSALFILFFFFLWHRATDSDDHILIPTKANVCSNMYIMALWEWHYILHKTESKVFLFNLNWIFMICFCCGKAMSYLH